MKTDTSHHRPSWVRIVEMQFALILRSGRWIELIGGVVLLLGVAVLGASTTAAVRDGRRPHGLAAVSEAQTFWLFLIFFLVSAWPALVWSGEPPKRRRSHWSLPVPRGLHDLARVAAGGVWVVIVALLVALVRLVAQPVSNVAAAAHILISMMLGFLAIYGVASIAAVITAHPARWFFGVLVGFATVMFLVVLGSTAVFGASTKARLELSNVLLAPIWGKYGFMAATGMESSSEEVVPYTVGADTVGADTVEAVRSRPSGIAAALPADSRDRVAERSGASGNPVVNVKTTTTLGFDPDDWTGMFASTLWMLGATVVLLGVSVARHEH